MDLLKDKVCLVTGAGGGIGSAICREFAAQGADAVIALEHTPGSVEKWKASYEDCKSLDKVKAYPIDIDKESEIKKLVQCVRKEYKNIDILVNAAAVEYNERIGMIRNAHMEQMFSTNVFGLVHLIQYVARLMMRKKRGSIVNIASVVGINGNPGQLVYSGTKGAVIAITKSAAKELAPFGIRVNAVAPGMTDTDMIKSAGEEVIADRISNIPMGRMARPEEIADAVAFLASDKAEFITGQILGVDGGTIM